MLLFLLFCAFFFFLFTIFPFFHFFILYKHSKEFSKQATLVKIIDFNVYNISKCRLISLPCFYHLHSLHSFQFHHHLSHAPMKTLYHQRSSQLAWHLAWRLAWRLACHHHHHHRSHTPMKTLLLDHYSSSQTEDQSSEKRL